MANLFGRWTMAQTKIETNNGEIVVEIYFFSWNSHIIWTCALHNRHNYTHCNCSNKHRNNLDKRATSLNSRCATAFSRIIFFKSRDVATLDKNIFFWKTQWWRTQRGAPTNAGARQNEMTWYGDVEIQIVVRLRTKLRFSNSRFIWLDSNAPILVTADFATNYLGKNAAR